MSAQPRPLPDLRGGGILFAEDFDLPESLGHLLLAEEPEVIAPRFSPEEVAEARAEAFEDGERSGRAAARVEADAMSAVTLAAIGRALTDAATLAEAVANDAADGLARLLLAGFAAIAPGLCARHGEDEAAALLRIILPALRTEPRIAVRVAPEFADGVRMRLGFLDPDLLARVEMIPAEMAPGDVRVTWRDGEAVRDAGQIWRAIDEVLAPLGLATLAQAAQSDREAADGI